MPLPVLIDYFNDRFEQEHRSDIRPFLFSDGSVSGRFGPIRVSTAFTPVRLASNRDLFTGQIAQISILSHAFVPLQIMEIEKLLTNAINQPVDFISIINLDRLCRTVHILNYLAIAKPDELLLLEVDPRHIIGIKQGHGAYFEEIIVRCGLTTKNVVISMTVNPFYALHHTQLLEGLRNYRQRGYPIALNVGTLYHANGLLDLLKKLSPDYLRIDAPGTDAAHNGSAVEQLNRLKTQSEKLGAQTILQRITRKEQTSLISKLGFKLIQGSYYDELSKDALRCL